MAAAAARSIQVLRRLTMDLVYVLVLVLVLVLMLILVLAPQ
jgi:hypothetical protein